MSDRKEAFQKAMEARKKQQEKDQKLADAKKNGSFTGYEPINWVGIPKDGQGVALVRMLGNPLEIRENATDPKKITYVDIVDDAGKKAKFIIPTKQEDPKHPFWVMYSTVMKYNWTDGQREYPEAKNQPTLYKRVRWNDNENGRYEGGWKPTNAVIMNVIDRAEMAWHEENKKTKLLSKNVNVTERGTFATYGVPEMLYNLIWDECVSYNGHFEEYDIVVKKLNQDPWYKVYHPVSDRNKLEIDAPEVFEYVNNEVLSDEEDSWEKYDIDKLFKISAYKKWQDRLGNFIKQFDGAYGENLTEILDELVNKELEEKAKENASNQAEVKKEPVKAKVEVKENVLTGEKEAVVHKPVENKTPTRSRAKKEETVTETVTKPFSLDSYSDVYPFISQMPDNEKAQIIGFDDNLEIGLEDGSTLKGNFVFKDCTVDDLIACSCNKSAFPDSVVHCPACGEVWD